MNDSNYHLEMKIQPMNQLMCFLSFEQIAFVENLMSDYQLAMRSKGHWMNLDKDGTIKAIVLDHSVEEIDMLEFHLKHCDLHITLFGTDRLYYSEDRYNEHELYCSENDVALVKPVNIRSHSVKAGYFAFIETGIPHANLLEVESLKMVIKLFR